MSTGASIQVPFRREEYYVSHDGFPSGVVPYLRNLVKKAKEESMDDNWIKEFELKMRRDSEDNSVQLSTNRSKTSRYKYKINEKGTIFYKDMNKENPEWNKYNA